MSARRSPFGRRPHRLGQPADPRFSLANERTFLAWNRTALALIGGGLAAAQLLHFQISGGRLLVALPLIALGAAVGVVSFVRWRRSEVAMRMRRPVPRPRLAPALLGIGAGVLALISLAVVVIGQLS
jgi:putative membrane protein